MSEERKPRCFVIGPISGKGTDIRRKADMLLRYIIRPALLPNYDVKRADEDARPGLITHQLITDIYKADLIVADLSSLNANAFYELGIDHALGKRIIHVCDLETNLPFDIKDYRSVMFDPLDPDSHIEAAEAVKKHAEALRGEDVPLNPFTAAIGRNEIIDKESASKESFGKLFSDVDALKHQYDFIEQTLPQIIRSTLEAMTQDEMPRAISSSKIVEQAIREVIAINNLKEISKLGRPTVWTRRVSFPTSDDPISEDIEANKEGN
jgi:hypothetical protein